MNNNAMNPQTEEVKAPEMTTEEIQECVYLRRTIISKYIGRLHAYGVIFGHRMPEEVLTAINALHAVQMEDFDFEKIKKHDAIYESNA